MYNRILVAIDGSNTSDLALREAMRLAKDQHAMLRLVHIVDITPAYTASMNHIRSPSMRGHCRRKERSYSQIAPPPCVRLEWSQIQN